MSRRPLHAVTGAFGYSGRHIARRLLERGARVRALTHRRRRRPDDPELPTFPLDFTDPEGLVAALQGVDVLYNTYWVRFDYGAFNHRQAVENTQTLFRCARQAHVRRIVHVSITHPDPRSELPYFRGKGELETALGELGLEYVILRPAILFGDADILINNIAWFLRRSPVFGYPGDGRYRLRPIHVDDLAQLAVTAAEGPSAAVVQAVGPEAFAFRELLTELARILGLRRWITGVCPRVALAATAAVGYWLGDVVLTADEVRGLMAGLLDVDAPAAGATRLTEWARSQRDSLGIEYHSELARRVR